MRKSTRLLHARLAREERGASLIEFALSLPIMMILMMSGFETVRFAIANQRVGQIAAMAADNASRLRTQMSEGYVNQLFAGVDKAGAAMKFTSRGRVILSSIQNNAANDGQWIRWQRCFGAATSIASNYGAEDKGKTDNSLPQVATLQAPPGSAMMLAEVTYNYEPLFFDGIIDDRQIEREAAFIVRQRTDFSIAGTGAARC